MKYYIIPLIVLCAFPFVLYAAEVPVYRFYAESFRSHFYTLSASERNHLITQDDNWQYEGSFAIAQTDHIAESVPLYRFWSESYLSHFFTKSESERDYLIATDPNWTYEGVAYYVYDTPHVDRTAIYRFWSEGYRSHFYTASESEKDGLIANNLDWAYEGIAYYLTPAPEGTLFSQDFEGASPGNYTNADFTNDPVWPSIPWSEVADRATVTDDDDKKLRMTYPAGAIGADASGGQALISLGTSYDELYFRQTIMFENGFDWQRGGKLPGLSSGGSAWSGGNKPSGGEGFSARYMWRDDGRAIIYLYHIDQAGTYGDEIDLGFTLETGKEYTLTQRIRRNTSNNPDGILEVWVSTDSGPHQKLLTKNDIRFGLGSGGYIDSLYFSTFFGGGDSSWAPDSTSYITFDDLTVTQSPFGDLP